MMKNFLWILILSSIALMGTTIGVATAQSEISGQNNTNDTPTTAAVANLTNASSSVEDAKNMSAIEGTMNQTE